MPLISNIVAFKVLLSHGRKCSPYIPLKAHTEGNNRRDIKLFEEKESKTETDFKRIAEKNKGLVSLRKKTMEGVLLRSKARWVAEGEKISKYFCNLEKRHYVSKQMIKLIDAKGEEIEEQLDINKEVIKKKYI